MPLLGRLATPDSAPPLPRLRARSPPQDAPNESEQFDTAAVAVEQTPSQSVPAPVLPVPGGSQTETQEVDKTITQSRQSTSVDNTPAEGAPGQAGAEMDTSAPTPEAIAVAPIDVNANESDAGDATMTQGCGEGDSGQQIEDEKGDRKSRTDAPAPAASAEGNFIDEPLIRPPCTDLPQSSMFHFLVVEHIESPSKFYAKTSRSKYEIADLEKKMTDFYVLTAASLTPVQDVQLYGYYAMRLPTTTRTWARVRVFNFTEGGAVHVYLIDHGLKIPANLQDIYPLSEGFFVVPAGAIPATLHVPPSKTWSEREKKIFKADVLGKEFSVGVIERRPNLSAEESYDMISVILISLKENDMGEKLYSLRGRYRFRYKEYDFLSEMADKKLEGPTPSPGPAKE